MTSELNTHANRRSAHARLLAPRNLLLLIVMIGVLGLTGCRTAPIRDIDNQPVPTGMSSAQVSQAIQRAGNGLGWAMKQERPGMISGTLYLRDHMAKVEIPYSSSSYSIRYEDSSNLKYDSSKRIIHKNYISWIQNLDREIRRQFATR